MHGSFRPGAVRLMYCVALFAVCAAQAAAADFTIAPNISGGFGNFRWDVAIGSAGAVGNPDLTLYTGQTYTFQVNTNGVHPFWIKTSPGTGTLNGYMGTGLSANGVAAATTITFTVPNNAPDTLYYNCGNHPEMQGIINIIIDQLFANGFE